MSARRTCNRDRCVDRKQVRGRQGAVFALERVLSAELEPWLVTMKNQDLWLSSSKRNIVFGIL